jgi:transcriptional regulator with XRE-family HTH domain
MTTPTLQLALGRAIRFYREKLNMSQDTFADQIEMHRAYYGAIERGAKNLTVRSIERLATGLGVAPAQLFSKAADLLKR